MDMEREMRRGTDRNRSKEEERYWNRWEDGLFAWALFIAIVIIIIAA